MLELNRNAREIVAAHGDKAIAAAGEPALNCTLEDPVYRSAKQAALALGFIEPDAECVAQAWLRQSKRTGMFEPHRWPDEPVDFGLALRSPEEAFPPCPQSLGLYAVLPTAEWVGRMANAKVPTLQLRFKSGDRARVAQEVQAAVEAAKNTDSLLFINDHWREAIEAKAYGVHLGQEDMDTLGADDFKAIRDAGLRLGLSTHGYAEMVRASRMQPSYIALGAVFPTTLKAMPTAPQGLGRLAAYAKLLKKAGYPGVAIGGISMAELPAVKATGVGSLAVVRAVTGAANPQETAQALMQAWAA